MEGHPSTDGWQFLLALGSILLAGLLLSTLARRTFLPRATLLLLFGVAIGDEFLDLIPGLFTERFELIADMTLLMVGFLLGGKLTRSSLQDHSGASVAISLAAALLPAVVVALGMLALGIRLEIAVLLGCIAAATAPAAIYDVVDEAGAKSRFAELLLLIVVLDDIWGLLLFGVGLALVSTLNGNGGELGFVVQVAHELGGAIALGIALGVPAAYLTGRIKPGKPVLSEALGIVFLCGGLAQWLEVSYLITAITLGAVVANLARHHERPFHAIEGIESLFMVVFFVVAGASLAIDALAAIGLIGTVYILCRGAGKVLGGWLGARLAGASTNGEGRIGLALLPQAGVAIGMALVAANRFPEYRQIILPVVIASTVIFEIVGPVFTRASVWRAEEE